MNKNPLKIISWNANGIRNKISELQALLSTIHADIVLIGETKLKPSIQLKMRNFHVYRTDNPTQPGSIAHGGTAVLVHQRIVHRQVHIDTIMNTTSIEISMGQHQIRISAVYKNPKSAMHISDLDKISNGCDWFIAAGDLNSKHPFWNSRCANAAGIVLYRHVLQSDFTIIAPDSPTFYPTIPHHKPDILDIALTRLPGQSIDITNLNELSSDHNPILLCIADSPISASPPASTKRINWKKFTSEINQLNESPTPNLKTKQDIDKAIASLNSNIHSAILNSTYTIKKSNQFKLPPEILLEIAEKNRLRREWQRLRDPAIKRRMNSKISFIRAILQTHRQDEWDRFMDSISPNLNSIYKLNKKLLNKTPAIHPLAGPNGPLFSAAEKAAKFADTFEAQFSPNPGPTLAVVNDSLREISSSKFNNTFFTTPGTIQSIIKRLPNHKAPGEDSITNTAIKNLPPKFILKITNIINGCLRLAYFPDSWKNAMIITIPKPGKDLKHPSNYRPIALLSSLSKIFERVILQELNTAIGSKLRQEQFAFRREHSTTLQLVKLTDQICINLNNKETTAAIFLDVEKAFDRVWHEGLIHKIHQLGTPIHLTQLINSFLKDRHFRVRVENTSSSSRPVAAGVPQGSCLSPLLYLIYTNDIPITPKTQVSLFADDTMFHSNDKNPSRAIIRLQHQINDAENWFDQWRLRINTQKTVAILFNRRRREPGKTLILKGQQIPWSNTTKYLGITFDRRLTFTPHIKNIIQKSSRIRASLYPVLNRRSPIPLSIKRLILHLYVRPILTYGGQSWGSIISKSNWSSLEAVQNIALRTITASPKYVSNRTLRFTTKSPSLEHFIHTNTKTLFYKSTYSKYAHIRGLGRSQQTFLKYTYTRPYDWSTQEI